MSNANKYYDEGKTHHDKGNASKAIQLYEKALKEDENHKEAMNDLGVLLENKNEFEEAKDKYKKAITSSPEYKLPYFNLARIYRDENSQKAIDLCKKAIELDNNYKDAYKLWGNVLLDNLKYTEAREKYRKCIEIDPNYKDAYYNIAFSYRWEKPSKAIEHCEMIYNKFKDNKDILSLWGSVLMDLGNYMKANEKLNLYLDSDVNNKKAYYDLATAYSHKKPDLAIQYCEKAYKKFPKYTDILNLWGNILLKLEKNEEAREKYEKCIEIDKDYKFGYYNIAFSYIDEAPLKTIEYSKKSVDKFPDYDNVYWIWGSAISTIKENVEYIKELEAYAEKTNTSTGYWRLGNFFLYNAKDYKKALIYFDKSNSFNLFVSDLVLDYSNVYDAIGDLEKAIDVLNEELEEKELSPNIYIKHNKAHYLFKAGQYEKSRTLWKEVLRLYEMAITRSGAYINNVNNYLYLGNIHYEIFGNLNKAEEIYKKGLEKEEKNIPLLVALNRVYTEKDKRTIDNKTSNFWQRNTNIKVAEEVFTRTTSKPEDDYFQMAELYYLEENYDKSKTVIDDYFKLELPLSPRWHNLKGQLFTSKEELSKAIHAFKDAIKLEGHNLNYRTNLANAYLKNEDFKEAELEFSKVLKRDPKNVDALIGLGEINLYLYKDDSWGDIHFDTAENYLLKALRVGTSLEGSKRLNLFEPKGYKEREFKDLKLSDLYYSIGYIKYERYKKNKIGDRNQHLNESLGYMVKSRNCNPDNLKARNAERKINKFINTYQKTTRLENFGALLVTSLSLLILITCQYFFFFHSNLNDKLFITKENTEQISKILSLADSATIKKVEKLTNSTFSKKNTILEALESAVGKKPIVDNKILLENIEYSKKENKDSQLLSSANYITITFGAILFLIAGLYLPKLLKLKVGVIELEKNSISEVNDFTLSGIQK